MADNAVRDVRSARLLERLSNAGTDSSPTAALRSGWYASRLQSLIDSDQLERLVIIKRSEYVSKKGKSEHTRIKMKFVVTKLGDFGVDECAVLQDWSKNAKLSGKTNSNYSEGSTNGPWAHRTVRDDALFGYPLDQCCGGFVYLKNSILPPRCYCYLRGDAPCKRCTHDYNFFDTESRCTFAMFRFPVWQLPTCGVVQELGSTELGVLCGTGVISDRTRCILVRELVKLNRERRDSPVPKYQNIIDPNIGTVDGIWVPTDFEADMYPEVEISAAIDMACRRATGGLSLPEPIMEKVWGYIWEGEGPVRMRCRMKSGVPDIDVREKTALCAALEAVLEAALPLLARLRRPSLLLPGPLQAVVKAQRIVLREDEMYEGVWHEDGLRESVVAVVLYYYRVSASLDGGMMEFASKRRQGMWIGDNKGDFPFDGEGARRLASSFPGCTVPINEGTLLVFSNYAVIHRVLRMVNNGARHASRDFVAFFVIDQRMPLRRPSELGPREERVRLRMSMLCEQLQPRGHFGVDASEIFSTGNGCVTDLAWLRTGEEKQRCITYWKERQEYSEVSAVLSQINMQPPVLNRGSSYLAEISPSARFNAESGWVQQIIGNPVACVVFARMMHMVYCAEPPEDGVCGVLLFVDGNA